MIIEEMCEFEICVECALVAANGDAGDVTEERAAELDAAFAEVGHVILGEELGFVWGRCGVCGVNEGGDKYQAFCEAVVTA